MLSKIRALKEKKGFTLVELIVVLVILAILAALLVPALTGYIDRANKEKIIAETRQCVMAAQTIASEQYAAANGTLELTTKVKNSKGTEVDYSAAIEELAEVKGHVKAVEVKDGKVVTLTYENVKTCVYTQANSDQYSVS